MITKRILATSALALAMLAGIGASGAQATPQPPGTSPVYTAPDGSTSTYKYYADHFDCFAYYSTGSNGGKYIQHAHGTQTYANQSGADYWRIYRLAVVSAGTTVVWDESHSAHKHYTGNGGYFDDFNPYVTVSATNNSIRFYMYYFMQEVGGTRTEVAYPERYANNF